MSRDNSSGKQKKMAIMGISSLLLVAMVIGVAVVVTRSTGGNHEGDGAQITASSKSVTAICAPSDYKETCTNALNSAKPNTTDPRELIQIAFNLTIQSLKDGMEKGVKALHDAAKDPLTKEALDSCSELTNNAVEDLQRSFNKLGAFEWAKADEYIEDLRVWLSGAITYQQTCIDGFENTTDDAGEKMKAFLKTAKELTSSGLAMVTEINSLVKSLDFSEVTNTGRRLMADDGIPSWVSGGKRRLLAANPGGIQPDAIVAKDGSGKYKTITEALAAVPPKNNKTFVIYIKAGVYVEQVNVTRRMPNVMFIGDGPTKTRISGRLNFAQGTNTYRTATVIISGEHFMAKNIGFENTAGAIGHQAVAIRVSADYAIFYNCHMDGYQDTLYAHTYRQFYRDCSISGTIDFIFGDATVVFQNCKLIVRKPLDNQQCIITAQGRIDPREPTGIVLHNCFITGEAAYIPVKAKNRAYLGRPWKNFSRTIIMGTHIDDMIDPEGWLPWMGSFALDTLYYSEFNNKGPGAVETSRVTWRGIKKISARQAKGYAPAAFFRGDAWVRESGVPYTPGMI